MDWRVWGFLSPATRARYVEQAKHGRQRMLERHTEDWHEDKTKFAKYLGLRGATYDVSRYKLFDSPPCSSNPMPSTGVTGMVSSPSGQFWYANRMLRHLEALDLFQGHRRGEVFFDSDVVMPALYEKTPAEFRVWMGISPAEMMSQRAGVRAAKGHVLIGGLGLGWLLWKVADKKSVTKITVVEKSQEILDWYGTRLCERVAQETDTEVEVICDDVLYHMGTHGDDVRHLIDIWPSFPTYMADLKQPWQEAIRKVKHFWGWGVLSEPCRAF